MVQPVELVRQRNSSLLLVASERHCWTSRMVAMQLLAKDDSQVSVGFAACVCWRGEPGRDGLQKLSYVNFIG